MRRLILPGIPFVLSLGLSLSTAGSHVYWQDSGFFLVAVKELGILYPPGFALYVLLCKAWTLALGFLDFTYAVHLFSAFCAAGAAGTIAVAARDLLRTKGPIFRTIEEEGPLADGVGASIGCLAASGYTFWASAILAKVYAFYFLILALLIWRMIRADEDRRPRDFTIVAALIGLAWQAHPSATNTGLALLLFVAFHRGVVGGKGLAWRAGLAALCAAGPLLFLPLFDLAGGSALRFGDPRSLSGLGEYLTGSRFTASPGAFGLESSRVASVGRYFWEEFLGVGALLAAAGAWRLWTFNRRLLLGLAAWIIPVLVVTVLFRLEGQHDFWMVAAWIPVWLLAAVGLSAVGKLREGAVVLALAGVIWAVAANRSDLDQRNYTLPETLGHTVLDCIEEESPLPLMSDDALSTTLYLQRVRKLRPEIVLLMRNQSTLQSDWPGGVRPAIPSDPGAKKAGEPIRAEDLPAQFRRARGQFLSRRDGDVWVRPEPYEKRLLRLLLLRRKVLADQRAKEGQLAEAARLYESIFTLDPWMDEEPTAVFPLAVIYIGLKRYEPAEATLRKALALKLEPSKRAEAYYFLTALSGARPEAAEWKAKALASPDLAPELRAKLEGR